MFLFISRPGTTATSGGELSTLRGYTDRVNGVALSADGRWVVSASSDKTGRVWDLEDGKPMTTFTCDSAVRCCAMLGTKIVAGDEAGWVHFLELITKNSIGGAPRFVSRS
jgi:WD40 repeat protein